MTRAHAFRCGAECLRPGRHAVSVLLFLSALILAAGMISCSPEAPKSTGPSAEKLREDADRARDAAAEVDADQFLKEDYDKAAKLMREGDDLLIGGKDEDAKKKFQSARREFDGLKNRAGELKQAHDAALAAQREAENKKSDAVRTKADVDAPQQFQQAEKLLESAKASVQSKDARRIEASAREFAQATRAYQEAMQRALQNRETRDRSDLEKKAMTEMRAKAIEAGAEKFAIQDLAYAQRLERNAELDFEKGDFQAAFEGYKNAVDAYAATLQHANEMKQITGANQPLPTDPGAQPGTEQPEPDPGAVSPPEVGTGEPEPTPAAEPEKREPPAEGDDAAFLAENIQKLAKGLSLGGSYDQVTGEVQLNYALGDTLRRDIRYILPYRKEYIAFEDPMIGKKAVQGQEELALSFSGNTQGFFLLPVPLKPPLRIDFSVNILTMDANGSLRAIFFCNENGATHWAADWLTLWKNVDRRSPQRVAIPANRAYQRSANYWFDKTKAIAMRVEVIPDENKEGNLLFKIYYDLDQNEEPSTQASVRTSEAGLVGFYWSRVKFKIRQLKISGILDQEAAVKILRAQTGTKTGSSRSPAGSGQGGAGNGRDDDRKVAQKDSGPAGPAASPAPAVLRPESGAGKSGEEFDY